METKYKYVSQLSRQQTNEHIQEIERVTNRKILEAETAEDKKAYLYKTISTLTETKDAILWKNRDLVKVLEEEYSYATNQALNLNRKNFEAMQDYEQRILIERFARQIEQCEKQQQARRQGFELPEILPPKYLYHEEYLPTVNKPQETEQIADRWLLDDNFGRTLEWLNKQDKDQYTKIPEQTISRTTTKPSSPTSPTFLNKAK
ncbi:22642_t:CDS:2, partial [Racocetra persica]